uniref:ARF like GTPase 4C n=3 Tax=Metatheria TaxID=9263 RepID=A0A7N4NUG5_SARHA
MGNISSNISAFQSLHIVMLGLDSAGKTTVLYRLKFNEFVNTVPTIGFNTEKIKLSNGTAKGISCHFWDVGGQEKLRPLWKSYSRCTDGIIYVVDSVDVDRLEEAKTELHKVTKFAENQGTPLLVIANKQDLPKSLPVAEIEKQLALPELVPATTYHVQPACAIIGEGLTEGMDKLYEMILKRRKSLKQKKKRMRTAFHPRPPPPGPASRPRFGSSPGLGHHPPNKGTGTPKKRWPAEGPRPIIAGNRVRAFERGWMLGLDGKGPSGGWEEQRRLGPAGWDSRPAACSTCRPPAGPPAVGRGGLWAAEDDLCKACLGACGLGDGGLSEELFIEKKK